MFNNAFIKYIYEFILEKKYKIGCSSSIYIFIQRHLFLNKKFIINKIKLSYFFGKWKFLHNKIIIKTLSMIKNTENQNTRKKL